MQPFWKTVWRFLKKLKIELLYDPEIALLGIYLKDTKILIQRCSCTTIFIATLSTINKLWMSIDCSMSKDVIYIYIYIYIYIHNIYMYIYIMEYY